MDNLEHTLEILPPAGFMLADPHTMTPEQFALSPVLAETLGQVCAREGAYGVMIREHDPYFLLGPKDRQLPRLSEAVHWVWSQGLPVYMRVGGGSAVLLDRACISFAVAKPCRDLTVWEANFRQMAQPVMDGLSLLGCPSQFGLAQDSYCEGPYDLIDRQGRKIAGIAQAIRGGSALVSGMIMVHQDPVSTTEFIQEFFDRAGARKRLRPSAVTALDRVPGLAGISMADVKTALTQGFAKHFALRPESFNPPEWAIAKTLAPERLVPDSHAKELDDADDNRNRQGHDGARALSE